MKKNPYVFRRYEYLALTTTAAKMTRNQVLAKNLTILAIIFQQMNRIQTRKRLNTWCLVPIWPQKRCLNMVMWLINKYPPNKLKFSTTEIIIQFFIRFLNLKRLCAVQLYKASWIQAVSLLQLPRGSLRPVCKYSCGMARQKGVNGRRKTKPTTTTTKTNTQSLCFWNPSMPETEARRKGSRQVSTVSSLIIIAIRTD